MRRALCVVAIAAVATAAAIAAVPRTITQTTLGGAPLGRSKAYYVSHFGTPYRLDRLEDNYERLVFTKLKLEVYFRSNALAKGAAGILTGSRSFRTTAGVGTCSTVATLESAYGDTLKPFKLNGKIQGYWVGKLLFATKGRARIGAVLLASPRVSPFVALNWPADC